MTFFPRKLDGKDCEGYSGQSINLNSLGRELGPPEKRALRFINNLSLSSSRKALEFKCIRFVQANLPICLQLFFLPNKTMHKHSNNIKS
jgi:hypothetical protein